MTSLRESVIAAVGMLDAKPADDAKQSIKKRYSELLSEKLAVAFGAALRAKGLKEARPAAPGTQGRSGAERRMSGALGAKKVDVTWATEESGLLLAISIKSINFRDKKSNNFQKNLINRRGDMLMEAVTLHRRFPYAVIAGFLVLDVAAASDNTATRSSTLSNAHERLKMFTGRDDPAGREEQFEKLFIALLDTTSDDKLQVFEVGKSTPIPIDDMLEEILRLTAQRNDDLYELRGHKLVPRKAGNRADV